MPHISTRNPPPPAQRDHLPSLLSRRLIIQLPMAKAMAVALAVTLAATLAATLAVTMAVTMAVTKTARVLLKLFRQPCGRRLSH